jgi:hypothetical protein
MAAMNFNPKGYGGCAPLSVIAQGELFWWVENGAIEPALRLLTPEPDHHWRAVHFPKGQLPKYVEHNPADQSFYLMAGSAQWRVDGIPSGAVATSGEQAGTICVGASANQSILCAVGSQGTVVKIDLASYEVTTAQTLGRAPFKHWAVGVKDVNGDFFAFYSR